MVLVINVTQLLRAVQAVFAVIVLGTMAYVANWYNSGTIAISPPAVNFLIFTSLWTGVALAYLLLSEGHAPHLYHPKATLMFEGVTMIFWFCGFIALAAWINHYAVCQNNICHATQAAIVFSAFEWVAWMITLIMFVQISARARSDLSDAGKAEGS